MRIAILTSGIMPVPAVQGGAVENLMDFYLEYNNCHRLHDITIYSVFHPSVSKHPALQSEVNHYRYIDVSSPLAKLRKKWFKLTHIAGYYHYTIEYYFEQSFKKISKEHYDVILIENRPAYALGLQGQTSARLIYHLHNEKLTIDVPQASQIFNAAARIICVSDYITRCVSAICPSEAGKCVTIHNGINLQDFSTNANSDLRKKLNFSNNDFIMVYSGRITQQKGIMELIQAMNLLKDYHDIKLLVIGSSFYGNADNRNSFAKALQDEAATLKERIVFTGFIPYASMPNYLNIADIALVPSIWDDPFPTTVLEAQAMGLPVITTCRGGIPEEVTEENAILLQTDEHFIDNLASAILDLYEHPEKRERMAAASLKRSKLFDKETYAKNFFTALT